MVTARFDLTWRDLPPHDVHPSDERECLRVIAHKAAQEVRWQGGDEKDALIGAAEAVAQWREARRRPRRLSSSDARTESWSALADVIESCLPALRDGELLQRVHALTALRTAVTELSDRNPAGALTPDPLSGLAAVIADAMWDSNDNRIGGPRAAAQAVEAFQDAAFREFTIDEI